MRKLGILTASEDVPLADSGLKFSKRMSLSRIENDERFESLFSVSEEVLQRITKSIADNGFDQSQPVHIWKTDGRNILIDGYTRVRASRDAGLKTVPVYEHEFQSFEEAYKYVLSLQVNRRNLSSEELLIQVRHLMESEFVKNYKGVKAQYISDTLGVSKRTVQRAMTINRLADEETLDEIAQQKLSLSKAEEKVLDEKNGRKTDFKNEEGRGARKKSSSQKIHDVDFFKSVVRKAFSYLLGRIKNGATLEEIEADSFVRAIIEDPMSIDLEHFGGNEGNEERKNDSGLS